MAGKVVGLGAGGHAKVIVEILRSGPYEIAGLLDPNPELLGESVLDVPILGDDSLLAALKSRGIGYFFIGLGSVGNAAIRQALFELALQHGLTPVDAVHPRAVVSPSATLGRGITIMAGAVINASARIGANVIVNTAAVVEHDCVIGDHVHIATGARLAGAVLVADGAHIGMGATVKQSITIGENSVVGAGAVVVKDVPPNAVVAGVPARPIEKGVEIGAKKAPR